MCEKRTQLLSRYVSDEEYLEQARASRERVYDNSWWEWYEQVVLKTPRNKALPKDIPIGELPSVERKGYIKEEGGE